MPRMRSCRQLTGTSIMVFMAIFSVSCSVLQSFSFKQLVMNNITIPENQALVPVPGSINIVQKQSLGKRMVVLARYQSISADNALWNCFHLTSVSRKRFEWFVDESGGGCSNLVDEVLPVTVITHESSSWQSIYGAINNPEIHGVRVTWDDGAVQQAQINLNTYLATRQGGRNSLISIQALNKNGDLVYVYQR